MPMTLTCKQLKDLLADAPDEAIPYLSEDGELLLITTHLIPADELTYAYKTFHRVG